MYCYSNFAMHVVFRADINTESDTIIEIFVQYWSRFCYMLLLYLISTFICVWRMIIVQEIINDYFFR